MGNAQSGRHKELERKPDGHLCRLSLRIDHTDKAALMRIAKRDRRVLAEVVRTYIAWGLEHDKR